MILSAQSSLLRLSAVLEDELKLVRKLRPVLERKQEALVKNDLAALEALAEEEIRVASGLTSLELSRLTLTAEVASQICREEEGISLKELITRLEPDAQTLRLDTCAEEISLELESLLELSDNNAVLTQNLVDYTAMVMRLLSQGVGEGQYNQSGAYAQGSSGARATLLDGVV